MSLTDAQVQRKLNQLAKIAQELEVEAKRRYGPSADCPHEHGPRPDLRHA